MRDDEITIAIEERWETIANTGDPDAPPDSSVETLALEVACTRDEYGWACERRD